MTAPRGPHPFSSDDASLVRVLDMSVARFASAVEQHDWDLANGWAEAARTAAMQLNVDLRRR